MKAIGIVQGGLSFRLGRISKYDGVEAATVGASDPLDVLWFLADLADRGVKRLIVEGGGAMHVLFLLADIVDERRLVVVSKGWRFTISV